MIDFDAIRKTVVKGLKDYLNIPVIRSNQAGEVPPYPYLSYTITTALSANNGTWGKYEDGIDRKPVTQTWSLTVQSDDMREAMELTIKAHEWLEHVGRAYLNDNGVIVQSITGISNRDNMLTVEYEYRNGFDMVLWLLSEAEDTVTVTGYVEGVEFEGREHPVEPTDEYELNLALERRLDGEVD